ncbi:MAG: hypothetical protein KAW02_04045 [candidate division Zixibacteria bacterium]|nr:hypothetical protein [candidate division Zixibacteria bacterium]
MGRHKSAKKSGGDFLSNDALYSLAVDWDKSDQEFSERYKAIQDFEKQLDKDMRITNADLKKEFQI